MRANVVVILGALSLFVVDASMGLAHDPPTPMLNYPNPLPQQMPVGSPSTVQDNTALPGLVVPCPPDPCPSACTLPACPTPFGPTRTPRIRVIMSQPEIVFQDAPNCREAPSCLSKYLPRCFSCKPAPTPAAVTGIPQGIPPASHPTGTTQSVQGQPQNQTQTFQTVPVTTFHAVPVTTFQTVPVTTFHNIPVTGTATFGAQATIGAQALNASFSGPAAFGVSSAPGFTGPMSFGVPGSGFSFSSGGQLTPMAQGVQSSGDVDSRLIQALAALLAQQSKSQNLSDGHPASTNGNAQSIGAQTQAASHEDVVRQFIELEKRLRAINSVLSTHQSTLNRQADLLIEHQTDIGVHEDRLAELEQRVNMLTRYKLTDQAFAALKAANVPAPLLGKLAPLNNKEFSRDDFVAEVKKLLTADEMNQFQSIIMINASALKRPELPLAPKKP